MEQWRIPESASELERTLEQTIRETASMKHKVEAALDYRATLEYRLAKANEFEKLKADPASYIRTMIAAELDKANVENDFLYEMHNAKAKDSPRLVSIEDRLAALEAKTARINVPRTSPGAPLVTVVPYGTVYTTEEIDGDRS